MAENNPRYLAVLPAYNEEKHLGNVIIGLKKYISDILVIDDGSIDRTAQIARDNGVSLLSRTINQGKGYSLKEGFTWALEKGYDAVIMLDSDGQHDPSELPKFIECFETTHNKLIIGKRDYSKMPFIRRIGNSIGRFLFSRAMGIYIPDNQSGFRMLDRELMRIMLDSEEAGFHFEVIMIGICIARNWRIGWVPIATIYGDEKSHQKASDQIFGFPRIVRQARKAVRTARMQVK